VGNRPIQCLQVEAEIQRIRIADYAEEHEELKTALTNWDIVKIGFCV
jgi:ribulose 1,5-bisphosphate carboxylase large subunit-like protein